jgi:hypothetical protein
MHPAQRFADTLSSPFRDEHVEQHALERIGIDWPLEDGQHWFATRLLRPGERSVQECPASVGVDLDQARALRRDVKIVAHEHANRPRLESRNRRGPRQDCVAVPGLRCDGLHGADQRLHRRNVLAGDEDRRFRKQVGVGRLGVSNKPRVVASDSSWLRRTDGSTLMQKHPAFSSSMASVVTGGLAGYRRKRMSPACSGRRPRLGA